MYFFRTPSIIKTIFRKDFVWEIKTEEKAIYITFDDGPDPVLTPWTLETLEKFNAKATFFCSGKNVETHPEIYQLILNGGHSVGNHTFNHINGWKTGTMEYLIDVELCNELIKSSLFRPPYGKLNLWQASGLIKNYSLIMWSLMSGDFDDKLSKEKCLDIVLKNTKKGTIIVFHNTPKAKDKLKYVLPLFLKHFKEQGYLFLPIQQQSK